MKYKQAPDVGEMISKALEHNMHEYGSQLAVVSDNRVLSYKDLYLLVEKLMVELIDTIQDSSTIVGLRFKDPMKHLAVSLALLIIRVTQVSINTKDTLKAQKNTIEKTGVQLLLQDFKPKLDFFSDIVFTIKVNIAPPNPPVIHGAIVLTIFVKVSMLNIKYSK